MVKGNKFKPGEPPLKKRRKLVAEAANQQQQGVPVHTVARMPNEDLAARGRAENPDQQHVPANVEPRLKRKREADGSRVDTPSAEDKANSVSLKPWQEDRAKPLPESGQSNATMAAKTTKQSFQDTIKKQKRAAPQSKNQNNDLAQPNPAGVAPLPGAKEKAGKKQSWAEAVLQKHALRKVPTTTASPAQGDVGNSNWAALRAAIGAGKRKDVHHKGNSLQAAAGAKRPEARGSDKGPTRVLAIDCEMVGVGPGGTRSSLARVCIVNEEGNVLMDSFVRQKEKVTDYRTRWSGIRAADIENGVAVAFEDVQKQAADLFLGRVLVGHAIHHDLEALLLSHPRKMIRDTSKYPPLMRATAPGRRPKSVALRHLALQVLGLSIQEGEHSPVDDARAALYLYLRHAKAWERSIEMGNTAKLAPPGHGRTNALGQSTKSLAALAEKDVMVDL